MNDQVRNYDTDAVYVGNIVLLTQCVMPCMRRESPVVYCLCSGRDTVGHKQRFSKPGFGAISFSSSRTNAAAHV